MVSTRCRGRPPCQPERRERRTFASFILFDLFRFERFLPRSGTPIYLSPQGDSWAKPSLFQSRLRREIQQIYPNQSEDSDYTHPLQRQKTPGEANTPAVGAGPRASPNRRQAVRIQAELFREQQTWVHTYSRSGCAGWHGGLPLQRVFSEGVYLKPQPKAAP